MSPRFYRIEHKEVHLTWRRRYKRQRMLCIEFAHLCKHFLKEFSRGFIAKSVEPVHIECPESEATHEEVEITGRPYSMKDIHDLKVQ